MPILFALLILLVPLAAKSGEISALDPPYTFEKVRTWQQSIGSWPWHYPPEFRLVLRSNGYQLLEAVDGGARGGSFVLYRHVGKEWLPISDDIAQSHHPVRVLAHAVNGWHDFQTFVPLWGSGEREVLATTYRWNGRKYVELRKNEGKFCDFHPFKDNGKSCGPTPENATR